MAWEHYLDNRSKNPPHKVYVTYDLVSVIFCGPPIIIILFMISPILYFKYFSYLSLYDAGLWFFGFILLVLYWRELRESKIRDIVKKLIFEIIQAWPKTALMNVLPSSCSITSA